MKSVIKKIVILVELEDGNVHQVNANEKQLHKALKQCLTNGDLQVFEEVEPIDIVQQKPIRKTYDC